MKITEDLIKKLPKTDLHVHLDGSLRIETIIDLAKKQKIKLPTFEQAKLKSIISGEKAKNLDEYLKGFKYTLLVLQTQESLSRAAYELAEDSAKENIRYTEVRYCPILHTKKGLSLTEVSNAVLDGFAKAEKDFNIKSGVIITGMRNMNPDISLKLVGLAIAYKSKGVVGFDLAGEEMNYPAKEHRAAFDLALKNNLNITIHAGEGYGPLSIHQAIHYCGSHRIGHGTRLIEDGDLLNYVNDHRIPIEICLSSNLHTKAVSSFAAHPLPMFYDFGLRVTLNTDNRLISNTTMTKEFMLTTKHFDFEYKQIKNIIINGFKSSFLSYREKTIMLNAILEEMAEIETHEMKAELINYDDKL
ncbi:MAG: adenosine deaminase [Candidatus Cloacimonetes bacterium]|nr:adenosine deaminase [Candidatus Cloacimonadota bacterium]MBL7086370.1 adenosine deaminase [Candidatus Cloacimonadota bacterium]